MACLAFSRVAIFLVPVALDDQLPPALKNLITDAWGKESMQIGGGGLSCWKLAIPGPLKLQSWDGSGPGYQGWWDVRGARRQQELLPCRHHLCLQEVSFQGQAFTRSVEFIVHLSFPP